MRYLFAILLFLSTPALALDCAGGKFVDDGFTKQCFPLTQAEQDQRASDAAAVASKAQAAQAVPTLQAQIDALKARLDAAGIK